MYKLAPARPHRSMEGLRTDPCSEDGERREYNNVASAGGNIARARLGVPSQRPAGDNCGQGLPVDRFQTVAVAQTGQWPSNEKIRYKKSNR